MQPGVSTANGLYQPVLLPPAGLPHSWGPLSQVLAVVYITSTSVCVCVCVCVLHTFLPLTHCVPSSTTQYTLWDWQSDCH